jgi:hypothetical protein
VVEVVSVNGVGKFFPENLLTFATNKIQTDDIKRPDKRYAGAPRRAEEASLTTMPD